MPAAPAAPASASASPSAADPARQRLMLADGAAHIDVLAEGAGPAVVLLPSSGRDSLDFDELADRIAASGYRVLRPQPRGMGRSRGPLDGLTLGVLAQDVATTIERLGGGAAFVVGHAFGHFVARVLDLLHPQRVRGVVVLAGAARVFPPGLTESLEVASDIHADPALRLQHLQKAFFAPGNDASAWLDGWYPALRAAYRQAATEPPKDCWWPVTHAPILDLQGACDPWRPPHTRDELRAALGDRVTVGQIEGASHAMVPERPQQVADAIVAWMAAHAAA
ncbi:MAG: alpha/beta hydrolase [Burkholderiaceae bacterium]